MTSQFLLHVYLAPWHFVQLALFQLTEEFMTVSISKVFDPFYRFKLSLSSALNIIHKLVELLTLWPCGTNSYLKSNKYISLHMEIYQDI